MWHYKQLGNFGFEVLRPNEDGDLEVLQCVFIVRPDEVLVQGPENEIIVFSTPGGLADYDDFTMRDNYLIIRYEDSYLQAKIEPAEGLVVDIFDNVSDELINTSAVWWEDL